MNAATLVNTHHHDPDETKRLADNAIVASVGSKSDSYDNALAESFNGLYKWELIYARTMARTR